MPYDTPEGLENNYILKLVKRTLMREYPYIKDVQIDYSQDWIRRHRGAIQAAYGKAPFFEHVEPFIEQIFAKKSKFLVDLNIQFLNTIARFLQKKPQFILTDSFQEMPSMSYWNVITPKVDFNSRDIYKPVAIEMEEFLDDWLPGMHSDVLMVGVNWTADLEGQEMEPLDLLEEFEAELD